MLSDKTLSGRDSNSLDRTKMSGAHKGHPIRAPSLGEDKQCSRIEEVASSQIVGGALIRRSEWGQDTHQDPVEEAALPVAQDLLSQRSPGTMIESLESHT